MNPRFTAGWLDYAQHCGFATDAARVRSPKDKPRVERAVQYVRGNFFAGEAFTGLADAQARAEAWCREVAGMRIHGTIQARPAEVFAGHEAAALLPASLPYDVPVFTRVKVHRDFHVEVGRALYSAPKEYLGCYLDARADSALVKLFHHGQLVKAHPRQQPGRRVTDPADLPAEKTTYAMRDVASLAAAARRHGDAVGVYADRLLDTDLPWTKMRQVYRLLGLVRRYGPGPVDAACQRALDLDVVNVTKIASMLEKATENTPLPPRPARRGDRPVRPRPSRIPARAADADPRREGDEPVTAIIRDPVSPDLRATLRALKLGQMLDTLPDRLTLARQQKMAHADFLELVLADEVTRREAKSAGLRARAAGLDPGMRLDAWDASAAVRYDRQLWNELTSLRFLDGPHGALILGPVGVGKTHLACALGHIAVRRRRTVHMAPAAKLFKRLKAARLDNTLEAEMRRLAGVELLILDDFALQPLDATETADFYQLCVERHQRTSTVVTSNRTAENGWP